MVEVDYIFTAIMAAIALGSLLVAFSGQLARSKQDDSEQKAHNAEVRTSLNNISEDVKDIKAEHRSLRADVTEAKQMALHASERAEAAHKRIDRSGIDAHD